MITINNLRADWATTREMLNKQIVHLEAGNRIYPIDPSHRELDPAKATAAWLAKLRSWRAELDSLLDDFPAAA